MNEAAAPLSDEARHQLREAIYGKRKAWAWRKSREPGPCTELFWLRGGQFVISPYKDLFPYALSEAPYPRAPAKGIYRSHSYGIGDLRRWAENHRELGITYHDVWKAAVRQSGRKHYLLIRMSRDWKTALAVDFFGCSLPVAHIGRPFWWSYEHAPQNTYEAITGRVICREATLRFPRERKFPFQDTALALRLEAGWPTPPGFWKPRR